MKKILLTLFTVLSVVAANAECRRDTILYFSFFNGSQIKKLDQRTINTFNHSNAITERLSQTLIQSDNSWLNLSKSSYKLDSKNNVTEKINQDWDYINNLWRNSSKEDYVYDAKNNMTEYVFQVWNIGSSAWENSNKNNYKYDTKNNVTEYLLQYWDGKSNIWINGARNSYVYDNKNQIVEFLYQIWLKSTNTWRNDVKGRNRFSYDVKNNLLEIISQDSIESRTWLDRNKTSYVYDSKNNRVQELHQTWFSNNNTWENNLKFTWEYDLNNNLIAYDTYDDWNLASNNFAKHTREEYICAQVTSVVDIENTSVVIYPNPANSHHITIQSPIAHQYIIADYLGNQLQLGVVHEGSNTIALPKNMCNGMYFLQIGNTIQKLIINQ